MGRRGNGEGSVRQRSDGRWESRVRLPGGLRVSVYGATRAEATDAAAKLVRDAKLGVSALDGRQPYGDWLARWLETHAQTVQDRSIRNFEQAARLHIIPVIGSVRLSELAPYHLDRVFAQMRAEGLRYFSLVYQVLHESLQTAMLQGYVMRNVSELIAKPADLSERTDPFTPEQAARYLASALDPLTAEPAPKGREGSSRLLRCNRPVRLGPLLAVMMLTGLRVGEAAGLTWRNIELAPKQPKQPKQSKHPHQVKPSSLRVVYQAYWRADTPIIKRPKTEHSRRSILLTPQAVDALTRWRSVQRSERVRAGAAWIADVSCRTSERNGQTVMVDDFVFTDEIGRPLKHGHIRKQHHRLCRLAGVPLIRPHDLRHSFATLMLTAGVNPKVVAEMLGHSNVNMTLNRYSHVLPDMQRDAVDALARLLVRVAEEAETSESAESEEHDAANQ
jgi:integrase